MRTNNGQSEKVFTSLDAYLAGYLTLKGFTPKLIQQGEKVVFVFPVTEELLKTIGAYNNGAVVEASRLALAIKTLKSQIHSLRRDKENEFSKA